MKYITVTVARANLPTLVSEPDPVIITQRGLPTAVLIPFKSYRRLVAMKALLSDRKRLEQLLKDIDTDFDQEINNLSDRFGDL